MQDNYENKLHRKNPVVIVFAFVLAILFFSSLNLYAEQTGETPDSGITSRIVDIYNGLVGLGYGSDNAGVWGNMGSVWNRIRSSGEWVPNGDITASDVYPGKTFYNGSRELQTGTAVVANFAGQALQDYNDESCANNNGDSDAECAVGDYETTVDEASWTKTAYGGMPVSVTDNGVTVSISSNIVYRDGLTGLYWSDTVSVPLDGEFLLQPDQDPISPTGESCNILSSGDANQYCDNQDPNGNLNQDNDVSAVDFCLNLHLDADNADGDNDGNTGAEADWRLITIAETCQASIDGAQNYLPNSVLSPTGKIMGVVDPISGAWGLGGWNQTSFDRACVGGGNQMKDTTLVVRCIRGN